MYQFLWKVSAIPPYQILPSLHSNSPTMSRTSCLAVLVRSAEAASVKSVFGDQHEPDKIIYIYIYINGILMGFQWLIYG